MVEGQRYRQDSLLTFRIALSPLHSISISNSCPCHLIPSLPNTHRLFFEDADNVDSVFGVLANSIIDGPLSKLDVCVHTVKAADAQQAAPGESGNRVICLYFEDCWNESHAKEVSVFFFLTRDSSTRF